jgi:glycosyltransferase involved in cell wall biosynthesis
MHLADKISGLKAIDSPDPTKARIKDRLWVVSEVYYPEVTSTGFYLTAIGEGLAEEFDVKVLCGQPNYFVRGTTAPKREIHNKAEIFRAAGTRLNKNVIAFRIINMLSLGLSMLYHQLRRFRRGDRVLVVTNPPNLPFVTALGSLIRGASYTLLIHDSYPETLIAVNKLKAKSLAVKAIDFLNRWLYKNARRIIVVGRDMQELVRNKAQGLDPRISVIPNWAELDDVQPRIKTENHLISELGLAKKLVFLHAGNIGHPTDVDTLLGCLEMMSDDDRFHFIFIGSGVKQRVIQDAIDRGLKNLTLMEPRPRSEQIEFLNACDVGFVSLVEKMRGAAMPSKTYNIMAAGKPILALTDPLSELAMVIDEDKIGWHLSPGNSGKLRAVLEDIYSSRAKLCEMGKKARKAAEEKYSYATAISKYAEDLR